MSESGEAVVNFLEGLFGANTSIISMLIFFTIVIIIYAVFIFYFYKYLARKNLFKLNLGQYNKTDSIFAAKLLAFIFYILEYIVILPVLTLFWFTIFSILLLLLAKSFNVGTILLISAAFIAAVRVSSYINQDLSQDLAKMIPFTLLALALTQPEFFNASLLFTRFSEIPGLLANVPSYLLFIIIVEFVMRTGDLIGHLFKCNSD